MEQERPEVYERIPWETLEKTGTDKQWLFMAIAGAVALGALAYTFMRNQPASLPEPPAAAAPIATTSPATSPVPTAQPQPTTPSAPVAIAEADLFAVDPSALRAAAASHAEWFAVEFFGYDGSDQSARTLEGMLPSGIPLPEAPPGVQVYVDWVGVSEISEVDTSTFDVVLVVRSLLAEGEGAFVRQPPLRASVEIRIGSDGQPRVGMPPSIEEALANTPAEIGLSVVPDEIRAQIEADHGPVIGGVLMADGRWRVVVLATGSDNVSRPVTLIAG